MILASACWERDTLVNVHQIARRFAARGNPVLFAESTGLRSPKLSSGRDMGRVRKRLSDWRNGAKKIGDNLWVLSPLVIANIWTWRPSWTKWPARGITTLSAAAGDEAISVPWIVATPGSVREMTAAAVPSPQRTAVARSS